MMGVCGMAGVKKVMVSLPDSLLKEVDGILAKENKNRSEFIREAMKLYLMERRKKEIREHLKRGYIQMAQLNLQLAEEGLAADEADLREYEQRVLECK